MCKIFCYLICLIILAVTPASAQKLPFTNYTPDNEISPLPGAAIYKSHQDKLGYLWFCVYSAGLVRYDGHRMELYNIADGLSALSVMNVMEDTYGRLWVLSDMGLAVSEKPLSYYSHGSRVKFTAYIGGTRLAETSVSQIGVNCLTSDGKGHVWLGTTGLGIIRYTLRAADSVSVDTLKTNIPESGNNSTVYAILARSDGTLWASIENEILVYPPGSDSFKIFPSSKEIPRSNTHVFYEDADKVLWGGRADGWIWKLDVRSGIEKMIFVNHQLRNTVYSILQTSDRTFWIGSDGDGVLKLNDRSYEGVVYKSTNGLVSESVRFVTSDREGNLWFSQVGGLSKLRANFEAFINLTPDSYLGAKAADLDPNISGIFPPNSAFKNGNIWAGSNKGAFCIQPNTEVAILNARHGLSSNTVYDITMDEKGRVWIGTFTGLNCVTFNSDIPSPLGKYPARDISIFNNKAKLTYYDVGIIGVCGNYKIKLDTEKNSVIESLWFNSYRQLSCYAGNEWFVFGDASGLPSSIIYAITFDSLGYLYVGTGDRGLYRSTEPISMPALKKMPRKNGSSYGREVSSVAFMPFWNRDKGAPFNDPQELVWIGQSLWVGSASNGLAVLEGNPLSMTAHFTAESGLSNLNVISMAVSPVTHSLWAGTNDGLYEIDVKSKKILRQIGKQNGLLSSETNWLEAVAFDESGLLYFGTPKGLSIYRPQFDKRNSVPPVLRFNEVKFSENLHGNNELSLEYAALSFANEKRVRYKTRLVGFDDGWSAETGDVKIRYTNLPAVLFSKTYTFEVTACNNHGVWSKEPLAYTFNVAPAWWLRWWAFMIYLSGFTLLFIGMRWFMIHWREIVMPKTKYIAHYKLQELLGEGGMGKVFKAYDTMDKKTVAVKVLNRDIEQSVDGIRRFLKEAEIGRKLDHPNIVKIYDAGRIDDARYLTMEFVEGVTLKQLIKEKNKLDMNHGVVITEQILQGLKVIHENDIIHRDIKSDNIMIEKNGSVKIMDFGLARTKGLTTIVNREQLVGTLAYMSPEQTIGKSVDFRSDLYSVGIMLYEMIYGLLPFRGNNEMELIMAIHNETPPYINDGLPDGDNLKINSIIAKCIEKDPGMRFQSCTDILNVLDSVVAGN